MTTIVTRAGKGSPLTNTEMDNNLTNLNTYKCETANNLSDLTNTTTARTNLGLGTMATQAANNVAITGGSVSGITDLAVADGGTGVSTITGIIKGNGTSAFSAATAGTDYTTPSGSETLTNKTISGASNTVTVDGTNAVGFKKIPQSGSDKTTSYTLATTDVGKFIGVGTSGSITIPDATFAAGDVISIFNNTTGNITLTCTITTAYISGTNTDKATMTLATRGVCTILFISGTVCVVSGSVT